MKLFYFVVFLSAILVVHGNEAKQIEHRSIKFPTGGTLESVFASALKEHNWDFNAVAKDTLSLLSKAFLQGRGRQIDLPDPFRNDYTPIWFFFPVIREFKDNDYGITVDGDIITSYGAYDDMYMSGHSTLTAEVIEDEVRETVSFRIHIGEFHLTGSRHDLSINLFDFWEYFVFSIQELICAIFGCDEYPVLPEGPEINTRGAYSFYLKNVTLLGVGTYKLVDEDFGHWEPIRRIVITSADIDFGELSVWSEFFAYNGTSIPSPDWNQYSANLIQVARDYLHESFVEDEYANTVAADFLLAHIEGRVDLVEGLFEIIAQILGIYDFITKPTTSAH